MSSLITPERARSRWLNVGCGPFRAPPPWWNVDVVCQGEIAPDELVAGDHLPYPDGSVERLYLGHVLEHVGWDELPAYLAELKRVLRPGGELLAVGPDVERVIEHWHRNLVPWPLVVQALEGEATELNGWPGGRHCWNCTEARLVRLLERAGFVAVRALPLEPASLEGWPLVSDSSWQCAVTACAPERTRRTARGRRRAPAGGSRRRRAAAGPRPA